MGTLTIDIYAYVSNHTLINAYAKEEFEFLRMTVKDENNCFQVSGMTSKDMAMCSDCTPHTGVFLVIRKLGHELKIQVAEG